MSRAGLQDRVASLEARQRLADRPAALRVDLLSNCELAALLEARRTCRDGDVIGAAAEALGMHRDALALRLAELGMGSRQASR
jgi:hypothetical protein